MKPGDLVTVIDTTNQNWVNTGVALWKTLDSQLFLKDEACRLFPGDVGTVITTFFRDPETCIALVLAKDTYGWCRVELLKLLCAGEDQ